MPYVGSTRKWENLTRLPKFIISSFGPSYWLREFIGGNYLVGITNRFFVFFWKRKNLGQDIALNPNLEHYYLTLKPHFFGTIDDLNIWTSFLLVWCLMIKTINKSKNDDYIKMVKNSPRFLAKFLIAEGGQAFWPSFHLKYFYWILHWNFRKHTIFQICQFMKFHHQIDSK